MKSTVKFTVIISLLMALTNAAALGVDLKDRLKLKKGDRIVFIGDSLTQAHKYSHYLAAWFQLTYPELDLSTWEIGRSGTQLPGWVWQGRYGKGPAGGSYEALAYPMDPDVVFVMLGRNGPQKGTASPEHVVKDEAAARALGALPDKTSIHIRKIGAGTWQNGSGGPAVFDAEQWTRIKSHHQESMQSLVSEWIRGVSEATPVLIATPPSEGRAKGRDLEKEKANKAVALEANPDLLHADLYSEIVGAFTCKPVMAQIKADPRKRPTYLGGRDHGHPGVAGHLVYAFGILKQLGVEKLVSSAVIDAANGTLTEARQCKVIDIEKSSGGISFTRLDERLPWVYDFDPEKTEGWDHAVTAKPEIKEWQEYSLTISGLPAGEYEVLCDNVVIGKTTAKALAQGWNMADLRKGPIWAQCRKVLGAIRQLQGMDPITMKGLHPARNSGTIGNLMDVSGKYYQNGKLRGKAWYDKAKKCVDELAPADARVHAAAEPVKRKYVVRKAE